MRILKIFGTVQFLSLFILANSYAQIINIEPGIYFSNEGNFKAILIKEDFPPGQVWQDGQANTINCSFLASDSFSNYANLFPEEYETTAREQLGNLPPSEQALFCSSDAPYAEIKSFNLHLDYPVDFIHCQQDDCISEQSVTVRLTTPSVKNQSQSMLLIRSSM